MKHVLVTSHRAGKSRMESSRYMRTVCIPKCCTDKVSTTEFQEHSISPASGQGRLRAQKKSDSQSWKRSILKEIEHILLCYVYIFSSSICAGDPGLLPPQNEVVSSGLYVSAPPPPEQMHCHITNLLPWSEESSLLLPSLTYGKSYHSYLWPIL